MGVICQIFLQRPPDGIYKPGSLVTGTVKYIIDKETIFKGIVVSLIGEGKCSWSESRTDGKTDDNYCGTEGIFSIMKLCNMKLENTTLSPGQYSSPFKFLLPKGIPPSYEDSYSNITYNIISKLERPGLFKLTKTFKAEIPVVCTVTPTLPKEPITYGLQKSVYQFFSGKRRGVINIKATIKQSLIAAGENAVIAFTIENKSKIKTLGILICLVETLTYTANSGEKKFITMAVKDCKKQFNLIGAGEVKIQTRLPIAMTCKTIQNSKVVSRDYKLNITLRLPMPHIDAHLEIPIEIGDEETEIEVAHDTTSDDSPPTYWEVMAEDDDK